MINTFLSCVLILPGIILSYLYGSIFNKIKKAISLGLAEKLNRSNTHHKTNNTQTTRINELRITLKFAKGLFVSLLIYAITNIPFSIMNLVDMDQVLPSYVHLYPWMLVRLCSSLNPIIYPLYHSSFFYGYKKVFNLVSCRKTPAIRTKAVEKENKKQTKFNFRIDLII